MCIFNPISSICMAIFFSLKVEHERIDLLQHPLVSELLNHKWNKIVMPSISLQLISYFIFLGFFTSYILLLPNPRGDICARSKIKLNLSICITIWCKFLIVKNFDKLGVRRNLT